MALKKIVLMGGTKRAVGAFKAILDLKPCDFEIVFCIFMPGHEDENIFCRALEALAQDHHVPYISSNVITKEITKKLVLTQPDAVLGIGVWRALIPDEVLKIPTFGYIFLHGTPLPKLRGFAGIYWQIINGYNEITSRFYKFNPGIDSGPYVCDKSGNILEYSISINNEKHLNEIFEDYDAMHVSAIIDLLSRLLRGAISFRSQPENEATYACHRGAKDAEIDWNQKTREIFNFIRGQSKPCTGAYTFFDNKKIILWKVKPRYDYSNYEGRIPGKVVFRSQTTQSVIILTNDGGIEVMQAQKEEDTGLSPYEIFDSIRKKCQSQLEARVNILIRSTLSSPMLEGE